jgi:hypothetical protein
LRTHIETEIAYTNQAIGVSTDRKKLYWTDVSDGAEEIVEKPLFTFVQNSQPEVVFAIGLVKPEDLSIDWLTGNIYITDGSEQHIAVCSQYGMNCKRLISSDVVDKPRAIALHPPESIVFWTDWGKIPHIGKAFMDGSQASMLLIDDIHWPNGLAYDWPNERVYWADAKLSRIESALADGSDRRIIIQDVAQHPYGVAIFESKIFISDWTLRSILSCNKFTGKNCQVVVRENETIFGKIKTFFLM